MKKRIKLIQKIFLSIILFCFLIFLSCSVPGSDSKNHGSDNNDTEDEKDLINEIYLTYHSMILNSDFAGIPGCDGFNQPYYITASSDNRHIYVTGEKREYIMLFERNSDGTLTFVEIYNDDSIDPVNGIDGLNGAAKLVFSPGENQVYVAGYWDGTITAFDRDSVTGRLSNPRTYRYTDTHISRFYTYSLAVSPDGKNVYAVSNNYFNGGISIYSRNTSNGDLAYQYSIKDGTPVPGDDTIIDNLSYASDVVISNDDKFVYISGAEGEAILVFSRDSSNGRLTLIDTSTEGLYRGYNLILSPDGYNLYVSCYLGNNICLFSRNNSTGLLTFIESYNGDGTDIMIERPEGLAISSDGKNVYIASGGTSSLFCFSRSPVSGVLTYQECFTDKIWGDENYTDDEHALTEMWGIAAVTVSPDGKNVYTVSYRDDSLHIFERSE